MKSPPAPTFPEQPARDSWVSVAIGCLCAGLPKCAQELNAENHNVAINKIQDLKKWRAIPSSRIRKTNTAMTSVLLHLTHRLNTTPVKIPLRHFVNIYRAIRRCRELAELTPPVWEASFKATLTLCC